MSKAPRTELVQVDSFLDHLKTDATRKAYSIQRDRYLNYGSQPSLSNPNEVQDHIESYLKTMKNEGLSWSYRTLAMSAIKHHYRAISRGRLILDWGWIAQTLGDNDTDNELKGYTREQIKMMLEVADLKYRAIILMLASSGMRREALTRIKLEDMEYIEEYQLYKIKIYRKSTSKQTAFISPEASKAVKAYIADEKPTTWLFPSRPLQDRLSKSKTQKGKVIKRIGESIRPESVTIRLADLAQLAGIRNKEDNTEHETGFRNEIPAAHGLRHFAINALGQDNIPTEIQKLLVGHTIGKARGSYVKPKDEKLLKDYIKAIPFLTIDQSLVLQVENKELKAKNTEIDTLKKQMQELMEYVRLDQEKQREEAGIRDDLE